MQEAPTEEPAGRSPVKSRSTSQPRARSYFQTPPPPADPSSTSLSRFSSVSMTALNQSQGQHASADGNPMLKRISDMRDK